MRICFASWLLTAWALGAFVVGCGGPDIRVVNESTHTVTDLQISSPTDTVGYGTLAPGETSDYEGFGEAYDRAGATFVASGYRFEIPVPDWSSQRELGGGDWTYHLSIADFGQGFAEIFATED